MAPPVAGRHRSAAPVTTACGRCPTRATSTSTTRPACSTPPGPTSARRASDAARLAAHRRATRPHRGVQRRPGGRADGVAGEALPGSPGHVVVADGRPGQRAGPRRGQDEPPGHGRPQRVRTTPAGGRRWTGTRPRRSWWRPPLVGVVVGPGVHTVTFSYGGYGSLHRAVRPGARWSSSRWPCGPFRRRLRAASPADARASGMTAADGDPGRADRATARRVAGRHLVGRFLFVARLGDRGGAAAGRPASGSWRGTTSSYFAYADSPRD